MAARPIMLITLELNLITDVNQLGGFMYSSLSESHNLAYIYIEVIIIKLVKKIRSLSEFYLLCVQVILVWFPCWRNLCSFIKGKQSMKVTI